MWWYCLLFLVAALAFDHQVEGSDRPVGLGRSIHINNHNLMGVQMDQTGLDVFAVLPDRCVTTKPFPTSAKKFVYYKDTKSLYSSLTTTCGLGTSLQSDFTLGFTLDVVTKSIASTTRTVTGNSLLMMASESIVLVDEDCLYSEPLTEALMSDLTALPSHIEKPWQKNDWTMYDVFLKKYGSHVMVSATLGASINQMSWADTSKSYSERDFQVKSCISLMGPTEAGLVSVDLCANVSTEEVRKVETMQMTQTLTVTGGSKSTRDELLRSKRTEELMEKFMKESGESDSPIRYTFKPIWEILQARFAGMSSESDNFIRAVNLEYYYLGYLNYGCPYTHHAGIDLQTFNYTADSTHQTPQYECTLAPDGCRSYYDCHYHFGVYCSCHGDTCIRYTDTKLDTGVVKKTAAPNYENWSWEGCGWKTWGSDCSCYNKNHERLKVWSLGNKNALYAAHYRLAIKPSAKKQEL